MLFNFPFCLPVVNVRVPFCSTYRTVNEVFRTRLLGCVSKIFTLLYLTFCADRPEILDAIDSIGTPCRMVKGSHIVQVSLHYLHALGRQFLRRHTLRIPSQRPQLPPVVQHVADNGSALSSGGARDQHCSFCTHPSSGLRLY